MVLPDTSNTKHPRAYGYGVRINDKYFRLVNTQQHKVQIQSAPLQADRVDTQENPEDFTQEYGTVFSRSDFSGGLGLEYMHRQDNPDDARTRYWDSKNIDISEGNPITLLPQTTSREQVGDDNLILASWKNRLYLAEGSTLKELTQPSSATTNFATDSNYTGGRITGLTNTGGKQYISDSTGVYSRTEPTNSFNSASDLTNITYLWGVKSRAIAAVSNELHEVRSGGTSYKIYTLDAGSSWVSVVDAGAAILAGADDGYIYSIAVDDSNNPNDPSVQAQTRISFDVLLDMHFRAGVLYYTTYQTVENGTIGRLWQATLDQQSLTVTNSSVIYEWGDNTNTEDTKPGPIAGDRESIYFPVLEPNGEAYIWRYSMVEGAINRETGHTTSPVDTIAHAGNRTYFAINNGQVYSEGDQYAEEGYLITPLADFYTDTEKSWAGARIDTARVGAGHSIEMYYTTDPEAIHDPDSLSWVKIKNIRTGTDNTETQIRDVRSRFLSTMIKLYSDGPETPNVRSLSVRAYPGPGDIVFLLPINVSDSYSAPNKERKTIPGLGRRYYEEIYGRHGTSVEVELLDPKHAIHGVVEQISEVIPVMSSRGSPTHITQVKVRGRTVGVSGASDSPGTFAIGQWAVMPFAVENPETV